MLISLYIFCTVWTPGRRTVVLEMQCNGFLLLQNYFKLEVGGVTEYAISYVCEPLSCQSHHKCLGSVGCSIQTICCKCHFSASHIIWWITNFLYFSHDLFVRWLTSIGRTFTPTLQRPQILIYTIAKPEAVTKIDSSEWRWPVTLHTIVLAATRHAIWPGLGSDKARHIHKYILCRVRVGSMIRLVFAASCIQ